MRVRRTPNITSPWNGCVHAYVRVGSGCRYDSSPKGTFQNSRYPIVLAHAVNNISCAQTVVTQPPL
jgi:hypothetical protein